MLMGWINRRYRYAVFAVLQVRQLLDDIYDDRCTVHSVTDCKGCNTFSKHTLHGWCNRHIEKRLLTSPCIAVHMRVNIVAHWVAWRSSLAVWTRVSFS